MLQPLLTMHSFALLRLQLQPVVSAASVLAKCSRDRAMRQLSAIIGINLGSGYSEDPVTKVTIIILLDLQWEESRAFLQYWNAFTRHRGPHCLHHNRQFPVWRHGWIYSPPATFLFLLLLISESVADVHRLRSASFCGALHLVQREATQHLPSRARNAARWNGGDLASQEGQYAILFTWTFSTLARTYKGVCLHTHYIHNDELINKLIECEFGLYHITELMSYSKLLRSWSEQWRSCPDRWRKWWRMQPRAYSGWRKRRRKRWHELKWRWARRSRRWKRKWPSWSQRAWGRSRTLIRRARRSWQSLTSNWNRRALSWSSFTKSNRGKFSNRGDQRNKMERRRTRAKRIELLKRPSENGLVKRNKCQSWRRELRQESLRNNRGNISYNLIEIRLQAQPQTAVQIVRKGVPLCLSFPINERRYELRCWAASTQYSSSRWSVWWTPPKPRFHQWDRRNNTSAWELICSPFSFPFRYFAIVFLGGFHSSL